MSTKSLHQLEENRFASAYLYGKLANIFAEWVLPPKMSTAIPTRR